MKYGVFQKLTGRRDSCGQYFRRNDTVDFVGDGTVEKPTTENIAGRHRNYVPILSES